MSHSGVRRIEQQRNTSTKPKSAGRGTSSQICEGMAEDYQEPMVIGNLKEGNEIRIRKDSSANEEAIIHNFKRRRKNYFKTYQRIIREKSDRRSKGKEKIQGIFPSTIHSEEERDRQKTSSIGCKTVEPAHEEETFQDGGDNNIEESYKKERLHDESRSDRRLLSRTYQQKISEISEVRMEGTSIPIQGITFWDHLRSSYFHKDNESTNSLSSKEGDEDYHLHRRHTPLENSPKMAVFLASVGPKKSANVFRPLCRFFGVCADPKKNGMCGSPTDFFCRWLQISSVVGPKKVEV
eukprot:TRINITY_DN1824_c0_g1_i3.p1 TRINITY_DN1824_c0_g1~~TRINITY_DN1824_c0_g1_i3.p1  ORF type:complete len:294 (+),score=32.67 TRINITY_DN1824_c0_g1_i3:748-1629(+)